MWVPRLLCLLAIAATRADNSPWKLNTQFQYTVTARTLTALHQVAPQYIGMVVDGQLYVQQASDDMITLQVEHFRYAEVHANLSQGWSSPIPEDQLHFQPLPLSNKPFQLKYTNGAISSMVVSKDVPTWELNILKSIASQLQVDTLAENLQKSYNNSLPTKETVSGIYKTMEDSVSGKCETLYDMSPLPQVMLMNKPHLQADGQLIDIIKTRNFDNCDIPSAYHFGITGLNKWEPASNAMGQFLTRSSISRVIIAGNLQRYTIQSSVTTNKIIASPFTYDQQKGMVVSHINLTLVDVKSTSSSPQSPANPQVIKDLVYDYNPADRPNRPGNEGNWQPRPTLSQAPNIPFLPMFIANQGNSILSAKEIQGVSVVKTIAQQIGCEMQSPSAIPGQKTLSKVSVLTSVLRTMNAKEMEEATKELYYPLSQASSTSSSDAEKYQAWVVYRDAVAQAGTGPALLTIKEWIQSKKVQGEEAAEILDVLPKSALFPDVQYMDTFFALVTSSEVQAQHFLNTSAVIAFTELARKVFVSSSTAHKRYPVHAFGSLNPKQEQPVVQQYIPYLSKTLKQAVSQEDSVKIRTIIWALGNLAHPRILSVYEPYLEGKEPMTHFQRFTMVLSLRKLAMHYPKVVRPLLFRIYLNTSEVTEVRVAAFYKLMRTHPPVELFQRIAQFTNEDQNPQVISAVQSGIKYAAYNQQLPNKLSKNAQAAVNLLNPKVMPAQYSMKKVHSYYSHQFNLGYKQSFSFMGSDDGFFPSNIFYSLRKYAGGFDNKGVRFAAMSSSLSALTYLLEDQFAAAPSSSSHRIQEQSQLPWSLETINNMLHIQPSEQKQVEGTFMVSCLGGKRFFAFDNHTVKLLPQLFKEAAASLRSGRSFNYTKLTNTFSLNIAFPTAMGLPFVFSIEKPTLLYIGGQARAESHPDLASGNNHQIQRPQTINASIELQFVYSSCGQSSMGFVAPFNRQHYTAGVNKNFQVNLPIRAEVDVDAVNNKVAAKVQPLDQHKQNVFEYSTEPYTSQHNVLQMALNPHEQSHERYNPNRKTVHVRRPNQILKTLGQDSTGYAFDFNYFSEQTFVDFAALYNEAHKRNNDPLAAVIFAQAEDFINLNNITLAYNPQKSSARYARFTAAYLDNSDNDKNYRNSERSDSQQASPNDQVSASMAQPSSSAPDSQSRQQQFLQNAGQGIQDSNTKVVDVSAEFEGQNKAQYVATVAVANSYVSPKARLLFFAETNPAQSGKPQQMLAVAESFVPNVPHMNYIQALAADPTSYLNAEVAFGNKGDEAARIKLKGKMQQSQVRRQYLEYFPLAQECKQQMQQGNSLQHACRNAILQANLLDQYRLSVHFENIPDFWKNAAYKAYTAIRYAAYQYVSEDYISVNNLANRVDINADFAADFTSVNVTLAAPILTAQFKNMRVNKNIPSFIVMYPKYIPLQLVTNHFFKGNEFPACVIENNLVQTFDNKSYPIKLGECWHAMLHPSSKSSDDEGGKDQISILIRDTSSSVKKEVMIVLGEYNIHMQPISSESTAKVDVNGQQVSVSKSQLYQLNNQNGDVLAQMYSVSNGEVHFYAPQQDVTVQYDGNAVKVKAQNSYRSEVRGLCGTFNTQPMDDFTTPQGYVLHNPYEFAATYTVGDNASCQGPTADLRILHRI